MTLSLMHVSKKGTVDSTQGGKDFRHYSCVSSSDSPGNEVRDAARGYGWRRLAAICGADMFLFGAGLDGLTLPNCAVCWLKKKGWNRKAECTDCIFGSLSCRFGMAWHSMAWPLCEMEWMPDLGGDGRRICISLERGISQPGALFSHDEG